MNTSVPKEEEDPAVSSTTSSADTVDTKSLLSFQNSTFSVLPSRKSSLRAITLVKSAARDLRTTEVSSSSSTTISSSSSSTVEPSTTAVKIHNGGRKKRKNQTDQDLETAIALSLMDTYKQSRGRSPNLSLSTVKPKRIRNNRSTTVTTVNSSTTVVTASIVNHKDDESFLTRTKNERTDNGTVYPVSSTSHSDGNTSLFLSPPLNTVELSSSGLVPSTSLSSTSSSSSATTDVPSSSHKTLSSSDSFQCSPPLPLPQSSSSRTSSKYGTDHPYPLGSTAEFSPNSGAIEAHQRHIFSPVLPVQTIGSSDKSSLLFYTTPRPSAASSVSPYYSSGNVILNSYVPDALSQEFTPHENDNHDDQYHRIPTDDDEKDEDKDETPSPEFDDNHQSLPSIHKTPSLTPHQPTPGSHYLPIVTPSSDYRPDSIQGMTPHIIIETRERNHPPLSSSTVVDTPSSLPHAIHPDTLSQEFENHSNELNEELQQTEHLNREEQYPVAIIPDVLSQEIEGEEENEPSLPDHHYPSTPYPSTPYGATVADALSQEFGSGIHDMENNEDIERNDEDDSIVSSSSPEILPLLHAIEPDIISQELEYLSSVDDDNITEIQSNDSVSNHKKGTGNEKPVTINDVPSHQHTDMFISPSSDVSLLSGNTVSSSTTDHTVLHDGPVPEKSLPSIPPLTNHPPPTSVSSATLSAARSVLDKLTSLPPLPSSLRYFVAQHEASSPCEDQWYAGATLDYSAKNLSTTIQHTLSLSTGTTVLPDNLANHSPDDLAYIFTVTDGHGGPKAALFASTHLPSRILQETRQFQTIPEIITGIKSAFLSVERSFLHSHKSIEGFNKFGTCVTLVLIRKVGTGSGSRWMIFTANAGDSRTVLASEQKTNEEIKAKETLSTTETESSAQPWETFRGDRASLLDRRIHNCAADAAGIPSLLCDEEVHHTVTLASQGVTIDAILRECTNQMNNGSTEASSRSVNNYFSPQFHAAVAIDRVQRAMALATVYNSDNLNPHNYSNRLMSSASSSFVLDKESVGPTISKAAAMEISASLVRYALTLLSSGESSPTTKNEPVSSPRSNFIDQLLTYRRQRMTNNGMLAVPLSIDHTCLNPTETDDVQLRSKEVDPFRFSSTLKAPLKTSFNKGTTTYGTNLIEMVLNAARKTRPNLVASQVRVAGSLMVTRALGDLYLKTEEHSTPPYPGCPYISGEPEVTWRVLQPGDRFLVLACDGIWDALSNAQAVDVVAQSLCDEGNLPLLQRLGNEVSLQTTDDHRFQRAVPYFTAEPVSATVVIPGSNDGSSNHKARLSGTDPDIGFAVPLSLGTATSVSRSSSLSSVTHSLSNEYGAYRNRSDSDANSVSSVSRSSSLTAFDTENITLLPHTPRTVPHLAQINGLNDVYFGNPAQRLIGAALAQQLKRQNDVRGNHDSQGVNSKFGVMDLLRLPCKMAGVSDIRYARRGFHDDMTAIVVLIPSFMVQENMLETNGPVVDINMTGLSFNRGSTTSSNSISTSYRPRSSVSNMALSPFVIEGIETFPFRSLAERFQRSTYENFFEWRNRFREERIYRGAMEWPIITHPSVTQGNATDSGGNNRTTSSFPSSYGHHPGPYASSSSYGSYVYQQQRTSTQQPQQGLYESHLQRTKSLYRNGTDSASNGNFTMNVARSNSLGVLSSTSTTTTTAYPGGRTNSAVPVRRSASESYGTNPTSNSSSKNYNNDNQSAVSTNGNSISNSRQSVLQNWWKTKESTNSNSGCSTGHGTKGTEENSNADEAVSPPIVSSSGSSEGNLSSVGM